MQRSVFFLGFSPFWPWYYSYAPYYPYARYALGYGYGGYYGYNRACSYTSYAGSYGVGYGSYYSTIPYAGPVVDPTIAQATPADGEQPAESTNAFALQGEQDFKAGDYEAATHAWRHAIVDEPENGVLMLLFSQSLFATGSFDEAAGTVQQGLQMLPEKEWGVVVANYKELYSKVGDYTKQLRALEAKVKDSPEDPSLRFLLGYHYGYLGYPTHAVKQLDKAVGLAPEDQVAVKLRDLMFAKANPDAPPAPASDPASAESTDGKQTSDDAAKEDATAGEAPESGAPVTEATSESSTTPPADSQPATEPAGDSSASEASGGASP